MDDNVAKAFSKYPDGAREGLLTLRGRIFAVAKTEGIVLEEALRRGQPAYLAPKGSTIRLGVPKTGGFALYTHCQTALMSDFKVLCPGLCYEGNRAVRFSTHESPPEAIDLLIRAALTYHMA
ncbi:MAG: DUF1801 domain-containing protein [Rhodobacteraceae bacterium]|nr:DUF1801 domain-containing protein [Paracoccaceae bacterium]